MAQTYQPLATKFRPQTFADVVGQEVPTTTLLNAIKAKRISHAYLFSGMRGVGKTTTARLLAKSLNCHSSENPTTTPCNECESCSEISAGRSIDVLEIDAASNTSVDDVRALQENLIYAPARDRYKVYIVDEVHMLSKSAFNAFLKTLEEPPPHVVFIFATTEMNKIPPTVLSRCLVFDFGRVSSRSISDRLHWICKQENIKAQDAAIDLIVFQSEGSIRDAISALDQVINFADGDVEYEHALQALGLIDREVMLQLTNAVIDENAELCFELVNKVSDIGADMRLFCRHMIRHVRDLLVIKVGGKNKDLLPYSDSEMNKLLEQSSNLSSEDMSRFFDILVKAEGEMNYAATPQYHLEAAIVKMIHSTKLLPLTELINQLQAGDGIPQPVARPAVQPKEQNLSFETPKKAAPPKPTGNPMEQLLAASTGKNIHPFIKMANSITLQDSLLQISVSSATEASLLSSGTNSALLKEIAGGLFGSDLKVAIIDESKSAAPAPKPETKSSSPEPKKPEAANRPEKSDQPDVRDNPLANMLFEELDLKIKDQDDN
jgi:DNA polymerase-3 subunit gamma/tau